MVVIQYHRRRLGIVVATGERQRNLLVEAREGPVQLLGPRSARGVDQAQPRLPLVGEALHDVAGRPNEILPIPPDSDVQGHPRAKPPCVLDIGAAHPVVHAAAKMRAEPDKRRIVEPDNESAGRPRLGREIGVVVEPVVLVFESDLDDMWPSSG